MRSYYGHLLLLLKRIALIYLFYFACRVLFFVFNRSYFSDVSLWELLKICFYGLRFDTVAILAINSVFILMSALPHPWLGHPKFQGALKWLFLITNSFGIAANCVDFVYFPFTLNRLSFSGFEFLGKKNDFLNLLPSFFTRYWYVFLLFIFLAWLLAFLYKKISKKNQNAPSPFENAKTFALNFLCFTLIEGIFFLGVRGGTQLIPVVISNAAQYTKAANVPLVINSAFSLIKTAGQIELTEKKYFAEEELKKIYTPVQGPYKGPFNKLNVVVIILESFSKEFTGISGRKSYTPFLDSIMKESLVFTKGIANGKRSAEGIPAILAGIPTLSDEPFNSSVYQNNQINSLASLLKEQGYSSAFFHGGANGTMNFDSFTGLAGFDKYFGKDQYDNDKDFDGKWGIWDEPYLDYFGAKLNQMQQPFLASVFTLSSHEPYGLPAKYKNKFPKGDLEIHQTIGYTDYSLKKFFQKIKTASWFENTLFVFTADHAGVSKDPFYGNGDGQYNIPVFFYCKNAIQKRIDSTTTVQQIDIMPTVLAMLGYEKSFFSFGSNALDSAGAHFGINLHNGYYQLRKDNYFMEFDDQKVIGIYDINTDSLHNKNLVSEQLPTRAAMEKLGKAFVQTYASCLINNQMTLKRYK